MGLKAPDPLWNEVTKVYEKVNSNNPVNTCIHCGKKWTSNSPSRIAKHLGKCTDIPERLWERFQPSRLTNRRRRAPEDALQASQAPQGEAASKRSKLNGPMERFADSCSDSEQAALDEALAEWIYGSGLPLHTVSLFAINISI
jgi:hypothetical protein